MDIKKLQEGITEVKDPRRAWGNLRHKLEDILIIGLCSVICKGEDFEDMELFGKEREEWLRACLKSSDEKSKEGKDGHLQGRMETSLTVFPETAIFFKPTKGTFHNPAHG